MAFPSSHKTVFVLHWNSYFAKLCGQPTEYDVVNVRTKTTGMVIPAAPITKTMWTCSTEGVLEYLRILYDIYPTDKLVQIVVGDKSLNSWTPAEQNLQHILTGLGQVGGPSATDDCNIVHGISLAVEALCQPSPAQLHSQNLLADPELLKNNGRIILITHMKNEGQVRMLEECILETIVQHNKLVHGNESLLPIDHCEVSLVHTVPVGEELKLSDRPLRDVQAGLLSSQLVATESGRFLYCRLVELAQRHFNLASTTVTGIPMKEEQNASSSANYDVELLHPADAHTELMVSGHADGLLIPSKEGLPTQTFTLKWCTPKTNIVELNHCSSAYRITPVDVNSRPSSCLTNFLLSGRAVMLEYPRKSGTKVISHMLTSHGGEIFIHSLPTARIILEDPPSISEGCGGRVTDYRIRDFRVFIKENRLAPVSPGTSTSTELPIERAKAVLERRTRVWPLVIGTTIIFNLPGIEPLHTLVLKEELSDDEVQQCRKVIFAMVEMERKNEVLPVPVTGSRGKGPKREEQYRQLWQELEELVRAYAGTSPQHQAVLQCVLDCKRPDEKHASPKRPAAGWDKAGSGGKEAERPELSEAEASWRDLDRFSKMTEREKQEMNKPQRSSLDHSATKKIKTEPESVLKTSAGESVLSLWNNQVREMHSRGHLEFEGRLKAKGPVAELYANLNDEEGMELSTGETTQPGKPPILKR